MEDIQTRCGHRWMYLVVVASRAVRFRRCERCGLREALAPRGEAQPAEEAQRLSA